MIGTAGERPSWTFLAGRSNFLQRLVKAGAIYDSHFKS